MPDIEDEAINDPDTFFTLPDVISLANEQVQIGNLQILANKTGLEPNEILGILKVIRKADIKRLQILRLALGVHRATAGPDS